MSNAIQRIKDAAARVSATTEKGSLACVSSSPLPCDLRRQREEERRFQEQQAKRPTVYGSTKLNTMHLYKEGRMESGYGLFPTMNATEAVGIASHRDEQDRAYRYGD